MTVYNDSGYEEQKYPYCGKQLSGDGYKHAMQEFKAKAAQEYKVQFEIQRKHYEEQIDIQKTIVKDEISNF